jgi:hypothetical protein
MSEDGKKMLNHLNLVSYIIRIVVFDCENTDDVDVDVDDDNDNAPSI